MKTITKISAFIMCFVLVFTLLYGCKKDKETDTGIGTPIGENSGNTNDEKPIAGLPDDLYSFTLALDGKIYALPAPFSEFAANGWEIEEAKASGNVDSSDESLSPGSLSNPAMIKKGEQTLLVTFVNNYDDDRILPDCDIASISTTNDSSGQGSPIIVFPGNIKIGSSEENVLALYGEPTDTYEYADFNLLYYSKDDSARVSISIRKSDNCVGALGMENRFLSNRSPVQQ